MKTKVEPTVGGWDKTHKPVIEAMKKIGYGLLKDGETFYQIGYELEPRQGITFTMSQAYVIAHSVQEAKAEERERIKQVVSKLYRKEKYAKEHYSKDGSCNICHGNWEHFEACDYAIYRQTKQTLDSVLSTLNTKTSLKQEEGE